MTLRQPAETTTPSNGAPIKVLVVDDSAFMRYAICQNLGQRPGLMVVGTANDGIEALALIPRLQPDVITLDVEMPRLDGLSTLRQIMATYPRPVIMLSSLTQEGAVQTIQALTLGAVDFVAKPGNRAAIQMVMDDVAAKIQRAVQARVVFSKPAVQTTPARPVKGIKPSRPRLNEPIVVIGASTGGPRALNEVVPALPADLNAAVVIIQHMPAGFTHSLAERLDSISALAIKEAGPDDSLRVGQALVAPGGFHMVLDKNERFTYTQTPPVHGVRPAIDVTLMSLVQRYQKKVIAAILTGMGSDGTNGCALLHSLGGHVIAEDESTCVVYGMPRSVFEAKAADEVVPLPEITSAIVRAVNTFHA